MDRKLWMQTCTILAVLLPVPMLAYCTSSTAEQPEDVRVDKALSPDVVVRAVRAHGGEAGLLRLRAAELVYDIKGHDFPIVFGRKLEAFDLNVQELYHFPNQIKKTMRGTFRADGMEKDEALALEWAIDGERVWLREGEGKPQILKGKFQGAEQQFRPLQIFEMLARHAAIKWTPTEDVSVDDKDRLIAMQASDPGRPGVDTILLFARATGLLHQTQARRTMPGMPRAFVGNVVFSEYRTISGVTLPMQQVILLDGKKAAEIRITQIRFLDKVDPNLFAPPVVQATPQPNHDPMVTKLRFADWSYEYTVANFGTKSQKTWGHLSYAEKSLDTKSIQDLRGNDYLHTPWGTLYWWGERGATFSHHGWLAHPNPYAKTTGKRLTPPDATPGRVVVAAADQGTTVALAPGDQLVVRLATLAGGDRSWRVVGAPPQILQSMPSPPELPLYLPGWESVNRQLFHFRAANSGKATLVLRHGGESGREWNITLEVHEK